MICSAIGQWVREQRGWARLAVIGLAVPLLLLAVPGAVSAAPSVCPDNFEAFAGTVEPLPCICTADATDLGRVWGMDVYTGDSGVCRAAVHAGVIGKAGGPVTVIPEAGRKAYAGVTRNGIASSNWAAFESSFRFAPPAATAPAAPGSPAPPAPSPAAAVPVSVCPDDFKAFADTAEPLACTCSGEATGMGRVWGMDVYTGDSSVCRAAVHAGVIGTAGGPVTVIPEPGRKAYAGVTRNGIASSNWAAFESSFRFVPPAATAPAALGSPVPLAPSPAAAEPSQCPDNFEAFAGTVEPLACTCSGEATGMGRVWGMDVYTGDSGVCRAAVHAGVIGKAGGRVTVVPEPGRKAYAGVTRNGISSSNWTASASSFRFAPPARQSAAVAPPVTAAPAPSALAPSAPAAATPGPPPVAAGPLLCPDDFRASAEATEPLACTCPAEATESGTVYGMDIYATMSALCRSALHAGVVDRAGGLVTVIPEPGRKAYAGVTRNGVTSYTWESYGSSFRFGPASAAAVRPAAPALPASAPQTMPVQQPIAASLRERGEVDLYVRFRTGSADLDPETMPVLMELRAAMKNDPTLNLGLIGHTDNIGSRDFNRPLSYQRAEAVRFWLASNGISMTRLAVDGRGFDEPLADNATEQGRATNRRVQAKRMP